MIVKFKIWFAELVIDLAMKLLLGNDAKRYMATPEKFEEFKLERTEFNRKDAQRATEEVELKKQVERYKGRMIIMRGWVLGDDPYKDDRMAAWFDSEGEPL